MHSEERYGWYYSLFAGAFAGILQFGWISLSHEKLANPRAISLIAFVALDAFVSARLAAFIAHLSTKSDHGLRAGIITWPIFSLLIGLYFLSLEYISPPDFYGAWKGSRSDVAIKVIAGVYAVFLWSSIIALPACLIGTALFNFMLRARSKFRGASR